MAHGRITREEAERYKARWQALHAREEAEWRETSYEAKLRQVSALMQLAAALGWRTSLEDEDRRARERWSMLRERDPR